MAPIFRTITFDAPEYHAACHLRDSVLRQPLGMCLFDEDLTQESDQLHFGLFDSNDSLIACVIAVPEAAHAAKLRQMAVAPDHAHNGHGTTLLRHVEAILSSRGFVTSKLHARESAIPFYRKCGYAENGARFTEVGISHVLMEKRIRT